MKKQLRKLPLVASLFLLFSMSCSKQEDPVVIEESAIFTLVISEFTPGDSVEIKSNKALLSPDIDVVLNNTSIKAYKISDFSYIFTLPVIPSGKYDLKLPTINKDLILNLTVKTYTPIANPTEVIAGYVLTRNKCFDEMSKNTSVVPFKTSPETLQMIDQIKQEWDFQFNKSSAKDKELLAYVLQKQEISADWFNFPNDVPASYFAKTNGVQNDVGDKLVTYAKTYITAQVVCVKAIPATLGTGAVFLIAPNPITAGLFLISFTTFIVSREVAERNAVAVGSLKGVAEAVTDFSFQKTAALELVNNFEKNIKMSVNFRNLKSTDATIQSDISAAFTGENELVAKDNEVKALYQKATSFTEKLKGLFRSYTPAIGKTSERSLTAVVVGSDIIIKSSSDANVTITSKMVGTNQVIKASSTSTTDINFNLKVAYKRKIDGQEVVKDIACVFKANGICDDNTTSYPTVIIGNQTWIQRNLNVCKYRNGDEIPQVQDPTQWKNLTTGAWCYYENNTANGPVYGKLYNWYAVNDSRGLAPTGYHVPSQAEWITLVSYLGGYNVAGGKMKTTSGWDYYPNLIASNSSGFTGLPGGYRATDGKFYQVGNQGYWWLTKEGAAFNLSYAENDTNGEGLIKSEGISVRCLKD